MTGMSRRNVLKLGGLAAVAPLTARARSPMTRLQPPHAPDRRTELYALLGDLPARQRPIGGTKQQEEERDGYVLETWLLDLNGLETVPAYLARPGRSPGARLPSCSTIRTAAATRSANRSSWTAAATFNQSRTRRSLTDMGYVSLCIDHWVFGERSHATEADTFKAMLWQGQVLWGMMVYDSLRALDFLAARPDVDPERVGRWACRWAARWPGGLPRSTRGSR